MQNQVEIWELDVRPLIVLLYASSQEYQPKPMQAVLILSRDNEMGPQASAHLAFFFHASFVQ